MGLQPARAVPPGTEEVRGSTSQPSPDLEAPPSRQRHVSESRALLENGTESHVTARDHPAPTSSVLRPLAADDGSIESSTRLRFGAVSTPVRAAASSDATVCEVALNGQLSTLAVLCQSAEGFSHLDAGSPIYRPSARTATDLDGEFDPGSGRTLAACLTHASRAGSNPPQGGGRPSGERVSNT